MNNFHLQVIAIYFKIQPGSKIFLEVNFRKETTVQCIATQGQAPRMAGIINTVNRWVRSYYLQYSQNGKQWKLYKSTFEKAYMSLG